MSLSTPHALSLSLTAVILRFPGLVPFVADSLSPHDLSMCVRVSKTWFTTFVPFLWRNVTTVDFDYHAQRKDHYRKYGRVAADLNPQDVQKYGHLIQHQTVRFARPLHTHGSSLVYLRSLNFESLGWDTFHNSVLISDWISHEHKFPTGLTSTLINPLWIDHPHDQSLQDVGSHLRPKPRRAAVRTHCFLGKRD
ncbi:hypothetical protein BGX33_002499 [Mortierella sp. NVP41]|nr:hypothetical protein BGX33_002499 [Mortierella sp. NVP41]